MMRKILLLVLLLPCLADAQRSMQKFYELNSLIHNYNFFDESVTTTSLRKQLQIKSIKTTATFQNSKKNYSTDLTYNKMGKNTSYVTKRWSQEKQYLNDTLESYVVTTRKNKKTEVKSTYADGYLSSRSVFDDGKLRSTYTLAYNQNKKVTSSKLTKNKKIYEIQNSYNEENKLLKTVYLINNKIKKEWIYECKPEGQLVASKTEELSSFCTYKEESADGSYTTFTRTLREGKPYLNKQIFNKDSVLVTSKTYLKDTILVWEKTKINNVETFINYKKSGKFTYKQIVTYDNNGNVLCREFINRKKGPSYSKRVFELNSNGTTQKESFYNKGKLQRTVNYDYTFY
jgi:antitoxin component YwqK of YwqJK toxin-antitoxin module